MLLDRIFYRANIPNGLLLLCCWHSLWAANLPITVTGTTETQIAIKYASTSTGACTITATDNNNGPAVVDLDASKFANASSDLGRTVANGFRWPTLLNGAQ